MPVSQLACHPCRWASLKDALSDLWAFELMYLGKLKSEFFEYWRILTEGPLFISDGYESALTIHAVNESSVLLSELDTATVLGFNDSRSQKEKMRGLMATFDMIECYNTAIEHWRAEVRPSTHRLASMLHLIAQFLAEFSEVVKFQKKAPQFLRKPLLSESMSLIGVEASRYLLKREKAAPATGPGGQSQKDGLVSSGPGGGGGSKRGWRGGRDMPSVWCA